MKTFFIPESLYKTSPWDLVKKVGGLPFCSHPLYAGLIVGTKEQMAQIQKQQFGLTIDPDDIVKHKMKGLKEAYARKNINEYVFTHERPYRFQALLDAQNWDLESDAEWFEVAGSVWVDAEGPGINAEIWRSMVFCSDSPNLFHVMNDEEFEEFRKLPETITAYRGCGTKQHTRNGLSWTTDRDKAIWFAKRYRHTGWLAEVTVKNTAVAALFHRRSESELIIPKVPRGVKVIQL